MLFGAKNDWDARIARCVQLSETSPATKDLLTFYARLLQTQKQIYDSLSEVTGSFSDDLRELRKHLPALIEVVKSSGPATLAQQAVDLSSSSSEIVDQLLLGYWRERSDKQFFAKALFQPYAQRLAESGLSPLLPRGENQCPFCLGKPQVSFLKVAESSSESGNRHLLCATCLSSWEFRRIVCASCGEERPAQLGYFQTSEYKHVRIETCDTCKRYIKGVDLTTLGLAVPLIDDVATAALDLWAIEQGYTKIELNLVGL
ncbi:MAG TPA: formate dehydrogenase accessory protein FdhE [Pyrinomonadaceae bacterium]